MYQARNMHNCFVPRPRPSPPLTSRHQEAQTSSCSMLQCAVVFLLLVCHLVSAGTAMRLLASAAIPAVAASVVTQCSCSLAAPAVVQRRAPVCMGLLLHCTTSGPILITIRHRRVLNVEEHAPSTIAAQLCDPADPMTLRIHDPADPMTLRTP